MIAFFRKYEFEVKIFLIAGWLFFAIDRFFLDSEITGIDIFIGIICCLMAIFYLVEVIELYKKRRTKDKVQY